MSTDSSDGVAPSKSMQEQLNALEQQIVELREQLSSQKNKSCMPIETEISGTWKRVYAADPNFWSETLDCWKGAVKIIDFLLSFGRIKIEMSSPTTALSNLTFCGLSLPKLKMAVENVDNRLISVHEGMRMERWVENGRMVTEVLFNGRRNLIVHEKCDAAREVCLDFIFICSIISLIGLVLSIVFR